MISSPSASTRSAVRWGRAVWPPGEASSISTTSQAEVIGPVRVPSLPDLQPRVAVQGEDPLDAVDGAVRDHVHRSAGLHLLGGLEDQPDAAGQRRRARERETGAQHHRGVGVVPARVHDVRHRRGERQPGRLVQREGVDVGAQRHAAPAVARRRRPGRCRRAGCAARGLRRSAARPIIAVVRRSARPSSGAACSARRQATTSDRCSASQESNHDGPLPAPMSTTAGPADGTADASFSRTVTGPHRPSTLRGASAHTPHPDGGVPSGYDLLARNARRGVADLLRTGARRVTNGPILATTSGIFRRSSHRAGAVSPYGRRLPGRRYCGTEQPGRPPDTRPVQRRARPITSRPTHGRWIDATAERGGDPPVSRPVAFVLLRAPRRGRPHQARDGW